MCFHIDRPTKEKIASKDIVCWKFLNNNKSPYFTGSHNIRTLYKEGKLNPIKELIVNFGDIYKGYHSYKTIKECTERRDYWSGFWNKGAIHEFLIPAGTRYYENETEYVSETIMLVK